MGVFADVTVAPEVFPLGPLLERDLVSRIEVECAVQVEPRVTQFCWITTGSLGEALKHVRTLDAVSAVQRYGSAGNASLVRIEWTSGPCTEFVELVSARDIVVLEALGTNRQWSLRLRGPDDGALRRLYEDCTSAGIRFEIEQLHTTPSPKEDNAMTERQFRAVSMAFENGFFDIPRRTTLSELSAEFDISEQALSKLIRRGVRSVLSEHLSNSR